MELLTLSEEKKIKGPIGKDPVKPERDNYCEVMDTSISGLWNCPVFRENTHPGTGRKVRVEEGEGDSNTV